MTQMQQQQQVIAQLQQQLAMMTGEMQQGPEGQPMESKNMLEDGSQVGGRESNFVSPRPNGA